MQFMASRAARGRRATLCAGTLSLVFLSQPLRAENRTDDEAARTIVVTGQATGYRADDAATTTKLPMALKDTPQAITVVTRARIEDFNLNSITDVLRRTPGIALEGVDSTRTGFRVRGFEISSFQFDGIPAKFSIGGNGGMPIPDMAIVERVEIVRGSLGLMTGVGDPSATINMVRKRPGAELAGSVALTAGSFGYYRAEADIGGAVTEDGRVRARVVGAYTNCGYQQDFQKQELPVFYGVIEADVTPTTLVRVRADWSREKNSGNAWGGVPLFYSDGTPLKMPRSTNLGERWNFWDK